MFAWVGRLLSSLFRRDDGKPKRRIELLLDDDYLELIQWYSNGLDLSVEDFFFKAAMSAIPEEYRQRWKVARAADDLADVTFELEGEFSEEAAFDSSNVFPFPPKPRPRLPFREQTLDVVVDPTLKHPCLYLSARMPSHLSRGEAEGSCQAQGGKPCFYSAGKVRSCQLYRPKNLLLAHS
jgi:hypothetical protein